MVLRPDLYERLEAVFGSVEIVHEDESIVGSEILDPYASEDEGEKTTFHVTHWGETYLVRCPFCHDHKPRLHINHMWGFKEQHHQGSPYFCLVKCFNEECMKQPGKKKALWDIVFDRFGDYKVDFVKPGKKRERKAITESITPPGRLIRLSQLPETHTANRYLRSRDFDPKELERIYRVTWCVDPYSDLHKHAANRLLIPIYFRGKAVGWQARAADEETKPKYYNLPDMPRGDILYNYDRAISAQYCVIVEGATGVWRVGPDAVALLGKTASPAQLALIAGAWRSKAAVVLLDPDAGEYADKLLYDLHRTVTKAVKVQLPDGTDPGSLPRHELRKMIEHELTK